jgi:hypothetical protein
MRYSNLIPYIAIQTTHSKRKLGLKQIVKAIQSTVQYSPVRSESMVASKPVKAMPNTVILAAEGDASVRTVRLVTQRQQRVRRMLQFRSWVLLLIGGDLERCERKC